MSSAANPYDPPRDDRPSPPPDGAGPPASPRGATSIAKLAMLAALYFAQGLPFGYFTIVLPNLLLEHGHSLVVVSLASAAAAPWALKFLWAPLVDRHGSSRLGRRKSWILPLQAAMAALLLGLASAGDSNVVVFVAGVFFANLLAATQDIATDGLAVDILAPHERGFANGIQVGGYRAGMILGGSAIVIVSVRHGRDVAFVAMAVLLVTATAPVLFAREPAPAPAPPRAEGDREARHFFRREGALRMLALIGVYKLGDAFATPMIKPFVRGAGFTLEDQAMLLGTYGSVSGMLGALAGGALLVPLGRRRSLVVFGALQILTMSAYAAAAAGVGARDGITAATIAEHFVSGMATAALFTVMMDFARPERAATDYTVQASAFVIAGGTAQLASGAFAGRFGFFAHFVASGILAATSVPAVLLFYRPTVPRRGATTRP